jgi:3-carboxymuconate cyclase
MKRIFFVLFLLLAGFSFAQNQQYYLLIGTYTNDIHVYKLNAKDGLVKPVSKVSGEANPSYLAISKNEKFVYAVNESAGDVHGSISAFSFDKAKGSLQFINKVVTNGDNPCYVDIDTTGSFVTVANYSSGNLSTFKTNADGSLQPSTQTIQHQGYGANYERQATAHVHSTVFSPDGKFVFVADLGTDKIYQYPFNSSNNNFLNEDNVTTYDVPDGSGPRHITFHPNGKFMYVVNELLGTVIAYNYADGKLTEIQNIKSDNTGGKADKGSADIHITPDGKYLYTSNRGSANDITIFRVGSTGLLTEVGHQSCMGVHPRNFVIDPSGKFLLVANRDTNDIIEFSIYKGTGFLTPTGTTIHVDKPVCLKFAEVK